MPGGLAGGARIQTGNHNSFPTLAFSGKEPGSGNDTISGGNDNDTVDYASDTGPVNVDLAGGTATDGTANTDTISTVENVTGSSFNDVITGDANA